MAGTSPFEGGVVVPQNVLEIGPQLFAVIAGTIVLFGAALAFAFKHRATSADAGQSGHRPANSEEDTERVSPDGFIDSFAGVISEAGGGMPIMGWVIIGTVAVCYVVYLFVHWVG
jgi:hypothetical protein